MEVLVYTQRLTPRVDYIIRFIFEDILGVRARVTSSYSEAKSHHGVLISYCQLRIKEGIHIVPHNLMIEDSIVRQKIEFFSWDELPAFFKTSKDADIPFDLFAASFYLISRYEEYLLFEPDKHNRFTSDQSVAAMGGFLEDPIIDQWAYKLVSKIQEKFPSFEINPKKFNFIPTFDVDNAYAYQNKGLKRAVLGTLRSFVTLRFSDFFNRVFFYLNLRKDPFDIYTDTFAMLNDWPNAIWFVLVGRNSHYDRNVPVRHYEMQDLIHRISDKFRVGVHPSYQSGTSFDKVKSEISDITRVLTANVILSRQHYMRIFLPTTYINLALLGIKEDYSMGYSDRIGFRAGTCTPFFFYNLKAEQVLNLRIIPFQTMDYTLFQRMKLNPHEALDRVMKLVSKVHAVNGTFVSIWHNEYLSGISPWKGWELLMPLVLDKVKELKSEDPVL